MTTLNNRIFNRRIFSHEIIAGKDNFTMLCIGVGVIILCLTSAQFLLNTNPKFLVYFADSVPHMVISRSVFDSVDPGLSNVGGVWLPLTHFLMMPLVADNFLFYSGLAGTVISSISTAITAAVIYKIANCHLRKRYAGLIASLLFVANPSMLYVAITPMMEALFMTFFVVSVYYILSWYRLYVNSESSFKQYRNVLKASFALAAATLTRYEGWLLPIVAILVIVIVFFVLRKEKQFHKLEALASVMCLGFSGVFVWIVYNFTIFKNPLYFLTGPYSAHAQVAGSAFSRYLFMNPVGVLTILLEVAVSMYGAVTLAFATLGLGAYLYANRKLRVNLTEGILLILLLLVPIGVDFLGMVTGSAEISPGKDGFLNGRYLVFAAPLIAIGCSSLIVLVRTTQKTILTIGIALIIFGSYAATIYVQTVSSNVTALKDPGILPSNDLAANAFEIGSVLGDLHTNGRVVLFVFSADASQIMFGSKLDLNNFIYVGIEPYWDSARSAPWQFGDYLVMQKNISDIMAYRGYDPISNTLRYWYAHQQEIASHYHLVYENSYFKILASK